MQTILIDGNRYPDAASVHAALKQMLHLPDYYGMNADALNDCLSSMPEPVHLWIASYGRGETERAVRLAARVFADNGGTVRELSPEAEG